MRVRVRARFGVRNRVSRVTVKFRVWVRFRFRVTVKFR